MRQLTQYVNYFFVDEAGDSTFYNRYGRKIIGEKGCSMILILGFIQTTEPEVLRRRLQALHKKIEHDEYLNGIPSIKKSNKFFHAKNDCPEVREKVFKSILKMNFSAEFIVARKIESIFQEQHKGKEHIFYDHMIAKLFENKLHKTKENRIYFAVRGNKNRQKPLNDAIAMARSTFEKKWKKKIESNVIIRPQSLNGERCLEIVDYMNWALQRLYNTGETRYYKFIEDKVRFVLDLYDFSKYPKNYYNKKNNLDIRKITPI
jgi:hypothetical protein